MKMKLELTSLEATIVDGRVVASVGTWSSSIEFPLVTKAKTNARGHHQRLARVNKKERQAMRIAWLAAGRPRPPRLPVHVKFVRIAPRDLDVGDNLSSAFKALRDELADCLGLPGDSSKSPATWSYDQERGKPGEYGVRIEMKA